MRIALDATALLEPHRTGVGRMTEEVLAALAARPDVDVHAYAVSGRAGRRLGEVVGSSVTSHAPVLPARLVRPWWRRADRPRLDRALGRPDVVHGPNFVVPPTRVPSVVTVHDLTTLHHPQWCPASIRDFPDQVRRAVGRGATVHTVSRAVRAEVLDWLEVAEERVVAIPNGYRSPDRADADAGRRLAGVGEFVLAVGTIEPRKGLPTLLDAVHRLQRPDRVIPLVHVGPDGWGTDELDAAVARAGDPTWFHRLGPRSSDELADLYAAATIFAYPSRYEGFGLPILEAFAARTPTVSTTDPAIAEVAGGAASLVAPDDVDALAAAIEALWVDEDARDRAVAAGSARVGDFSWEATGDALVDLYRRLTEGPVEGAGNPAGR